VAAIGVRKQDIATMSKLFSFLFFFLLFSKGVFFSTSFSFFPTSLCNGSLSLLPSYFTKWSLLGWTVAVWEFYINVCVNVYDILVT